MHCLVVLVGLCLLSSQVFANMSSRFVDSHNSRREKYHELADKKYVPVKHSVELEKQSKKIADFLVNRSPACVMQHCKFLPEETRDRLGVNCNYGENLFVRYGIAKPTTENVLAAWVEEEEDLFNSPNATYQNAGHFSTVLWRATKYVGCHVSTSVESQCHIAVCTYAKPGNCGEDKGERIFRLYADNSDCEPFCPPEGCF
jgi:hypothetical protein